MCGIAGFSGRHATSPQVIEHMLDALRQRGPDAQHWTGWNAALQADSSSVHTALLHARLSIIDPRPEADQPMANERGDVWICYNGEVYDWSDLAAELRGLGVVFRTRSDTEVILHAYETWGIGCLSRLRGMFAFAILDLRVGALWLVRDRVGKKPLIYAQIGSDLVFGSTVRAVLPWVPKPLRGFDSQAIDAYLAHRYVPAPRTIFSAVRRLENAHYLRFDLHTRELTKHCYWEPEARPANWLQTLDDAVQMRTVADRPLGLFLSSGIDSSTVACRLAAHGYQHLQTFTAGFAGSRMDESADAAEIARVLGFKQSIVPIPSRISEDFDQIIADLDEPFADPSAIPTWYLARATTQHVKVVLGGDGGDELLAGYKRIAKHLRSAYRRGFFIPTLSTVASVDGKGWSKLSDEVRTSWENAYGLRFSGFTPGQRLALQPQGWAQVHYWRMPNNIEKLSARHALLEIDRLNYLPEYILRKADLCTMAHGLELRAPLLDQVWIEALMALPDEQRFTNPPKLLLNQAMPQLAALKLFERKKRGFNPPLEAWLREDLGGRLDSLGTRLAGLTEGQIAPAAVSALLAQYRAGKSALAEQVMQLLTLEIALAQLDKVRKDYV